eukprot:CAMPEP_0181347502 /NCGR_PEP_ID=MMETSP1101-20121128/33913_1 /TAXON_ID=46948 /ORGANISM="Rhodomonas abbreviata, Strain Caron Lab Isolate" /LENGTH=1140 /DNA_ID=CAMNT_0023459721 /DNA_START=59 /DNA_END=3477 /DNA_ORIENTATION=+
MASNQPCQLCEDTQATLYCKQCQEVFCQECFEALHYSGKRQGHDVEPLSTANAPKQVAAQPSSGPMRTVAPAAAPLQSAPPPPQSNENIGGVGLFLKPNDKGELEIVRLARGGSAERSGAIEQGDIVMEVAGQDVYKKDFGVFAKLIQGPVGTYVKVKVAKGNDLAQQKEIDLERTLNPEGAPPPPPVQSAPPPAATPLSQQPPLGSSMSTAADIGIDFKADETGCFQITGMKPGGPANASGQVDIGDILYEIDGVKVLYGIGPNGRSLSNIEITEMLRGPEGSVLNLRLQKGRMGRLAHVNLTRTSGLAQPKPPAPAAAPALNAPPPPPAAPPAPASGDRALALAAPDPPRRSPQVERPQAVRAAAPPRAPILPPDRMDMMDKTKDDTVVAQPQPPAPPPPQPPSPPESAPPPPGSGSVPPNQQGPPPPQQPLTPLYGSNQSGFGFGDPPSDLYGDMQVQPISQDQMQIQGPPSHQMQQMVPQNMQNQLMTYPYGAPQQQQMIPHPVMNQPEPEPNIDKSYADSYNPDPPDRFGLGLLLKPYGQGQLRIAEVLPGGPAELSGQDVQKGDWLQHIDMQPVYKQPTQKVISLLQSKQKGEFVRLGLRRPTDREQKDHEVFIVKGNTGVKLMNCGVGVVFKQDFDDFNNGWVRVGQVVPDGPAMKSLGEDIIKVNDRVVEVNGENVARQPLQKWVHLLKGPESSSCVLTLGDVNAELYTCNIERGVVDQSKVDPNADKIAPPLIEKPILIQPRKIAPQKKYMANVYGVTCGLSFVTNAEGQVVIDHINPKGPAAKIEGMGPGDILREIGDGPDSREKKFPAQDVYKRPVQEWMNVITEGTPEESVLFMFERMDGSTYDVSIEREIIARITNGNEKLARVGIQLSKHAGTLMVHDVDPGSDAQKVGVQKGYFLLSANGEPMTGDLDLIQERMNENLIAPISEAGAKTVKLIFNTAAGKIKFDVLCDVPLKVPPLPSKPKKNKDACIPFYNGLIAGEGIPARPMENPDLWKSLNTVLQDANEVPPPNPENGKPMADSFIWRGRILKKPVVGPDGMTRVTDAKTGENIYWGPGDKEPSLLPEDPNANKQLKTKKVRELSGPTRQARGLSALPMAQSPAAPFTPPQQRQQPQNDQQRSAPAPAPAP